VGQQSFEQTARPLHSWLLVFLWGAKAGIAAFFPVFFVATLLFRRSSGPLVTTLAVGAAISANRRLTSMSRPITLLDQTVP